MACRGDWTQSPRSCPCAYPLRARDQSRGPSLPACLSRRSAVLRPPRTPAALQGIHHRLIPLAFARRRLSRRASPVPNQTVCTCRSPYPGRTRRADPGPGLDRHGPSPRHERLGSSVIRLTRLQDSHLTALRPAHLLPPKRLSTPRLTRRLSTTSRGLLPGAPVPTGAGLPPASPVQLAGRNMETTLRAALARGSPGRLRNAPTPDRMGAMINDDGGSTW